MATPRLAALQRAGTRHVYADTADVGELGALLALEGGAIWREVDGNTANQPLIRKVVERYLEGGAPREWAAALRARDPELPDQVLRTLLYAIVCGRIGSDMVRCFASGRAWEVSLQLHMDLGFQPRVARHIGRILRGMVGSAIVKVPFRPDAPACFLVARDLERAGIPVNFTSTFSARQVVAAALLAGVTRTNIFMGRLNQGLEAALLGEHVTLEAQRALQRVRREDGVATQLIVASVRDWQTLVHLAGCDVFTAPCPVLRDFVQQQEISSDEIRSQLETSYAAEVGVSDRVAKALGNERIARLHHVEPELITFLRELRRARDYMSLDGDGLYERFERAGFGDLFHAPAPAEAEELDRGKLPDLDGELVERIPIDTHYSLLANADFARYQDEIDAEIEKRLRGATR